MASRTLAKGKTGAALQGPKSSRRLWSRHELVTLLADRVAPASFFMFFLAAKASHLSTLFGQAEAANGAGRWQFYLDVANHILGGLFIALVIGLCMSRSPSIRKETGALRRIVALAATLIPTTIALAPIATDDIGISLIASLLIMGGLAIATAGLLALRRCFGILPEVRGMVTGGLYRHVRHPVYLGEGIAALGITLTVLSPVTITILMAFFLLQWRRAMNEETLFAATFPEYREYSRRTRQFVPLLW